MDTNKIVAVIGTNAWGSDAYEKIIRGSVVDQNTLQQAVHLAVEKNMALFDTAQDYGLGKCQKMIGELCKEGTYISSKFTPIIGKYVSGQVQKSLEKDLLEMKREQIDIYWLHLPNCIDDNMKEIIQLYRDNKIAHIGISNFSLIECKHVKEILDDAGIPLYGVQNHYSLVNRDWEKNGVVSWCKEHGIAFWAWAVLEEGILVGPVNKKQEKGSLIKLIYSKKRKKLNVLFQDMEVVGKKYDMTIAQVAISYVASKGIVPICGCRKPYQVEQLYQAAHTLLSSKDIELLEHSADLLNVHIMGADLFRFAVKKVK